MREHHLFGMASMALKVNPYFSKLYLSMPITTGS